MTTPTSQTQQSEPSTTQNSTNSNENVAMDTQTSTYNRSQWVALLVDKMKYSVSEEVFEKDAETGKILYSYDDISGDKNALKIEAAVKFGIIPVEDENSFLPEEQVTREFAATTAVRAIGYVTDMELVCSDCADLRYPEEDKVAIDVGMFSLIEGAFYPSVVASKEELELIINMIEKKVAEQTIDPNHEDVLVYTDAVVEAPKNLVNYTVASAEESSDRLLVTLPMGSNEINDLNVGKILVLPANDMFAEGFPLKVESMVTIGEQIILTGQIPEDIFEVYETVDIQGYAYIDENNIKLADGVKVVEDNNVASSADESLFNNRKGYGIPIPFKETFNIELDESGEFEIPEESMEGNAEIEAKATLSIEIPRLEYKLNYSKEDASEIFVKIPSVVEATCKASGSCDFTTKIFESGYIPLKAGFEAKITVNATIAMDGSVSLTSTIESEVGVECVDGKPSIINPPCEKSVNGTANVELEIGPAVLVEFTWMGTVQDYINEIINKDEEPIVIYNVEIYAAIGIKSESVTRSDMICTDNRIYFYCTLKCGEDSVLADMFSFLEFEKDICNEEITRWHSENFKKITSGICTYLNSKGKYSGKWKGMDWSIDENGKLSISGTYVEQYLLSTVPNWLAYYREIKTAVITAENVASTNKWFYCCNNLISVDMSKFNTSKVTDMSLMFYGCNNLKNIKWGSFKTSSVVNMSGMFENCSKLTSINTSTFNTSRVVDMSDMFNGCKKLRRLNLTKFNTSKVTNMSSMFSDCSNLKSLNLSKFNTSNVTDMNSMFKGCSKLEKLNLSKFNTSKVTNMGAMFSNCKGLLDLNLDGFDTTKVTNMFSMFEGCKNLSTLDLNSFNTKNVVTMRQMFNYCEKLNDINIKNFDTSNVTSMNSMFSNCYNLTDIDLTNFHTKNLTDMYGMFWQCGNLTVLDLSSFDVSQARSLGNMLGGCDKLQTIKSPKNLKVEFMLPVYYHPERDDVILQQIEWHDASGTTHKYMPMNKAESIELKRVDMVY